MNCKLSGSREIATNTNVCDDYVYAGKCHFWFSYMLGSSLLTFDYLLESFGFKTFKFGGSQLQNNI